MKRNQKKFILFVLLAALQVTTLWGMQKTGTQPIKVSPKKPAVLAWQPGTGAKSFVAVVTDADKTKADNKDAKLVKTGPATAGKPGITFKSVKPEDSPESSPESSHLEKKRPSEPTPESQTKTQHSGSAQARSITPTPEKPKQSGRPTSQPTLAHGLGLPPKTQKKEAKTVVLNLRAFIDMANSVDPKPLLIPDTEEEQKEAKKHFFESLKKRNRLFEPLYADFPRMTEQFVASVQKQLDDEKLWIDGKKRAPFSIEFKSPEFSPYVQKKDFDDKSIIYQWGDLHGGFHSLINMLASLYDHGVIGSNLKIKDKNVYFMFLGDFVDRGYFGVEVMYLVMMLKCLNPDQVFLLRGNHEDIAYNGNFFNGFAFEAQAKIKDKDILKKINRVYDLLPVAFYANRILCCHGGIDLAYLSGKLLECKEPLKYELLSDENYHPGVLLSQLSPEVQHTIVNRLMAFAVNGLIVNMKNQLYSPFNGYSSLAGNILQSISATDIDDGKATHEETAPKLEAFNVITSALNEQLAEFKKFDETSLHCAKTLKTHLDNAKNLVHDLLMIFKGEVTRQQDLAPTMLKNLCQSGATMSDELKDVDKNGAVSIYGKLFTHFNTLATITDKLKKGLEKSEQHAAELKAYETSEDTQACLSNFTRLLTELELMYDFESREGMLSNMLVQAFGVKDRKEFEDLMIEFRFSAEILPALFGTYGIFSEFFTYKVLKKPDDPGQIGSLWNDFCVDSKGAHFDMEDGGRHILGALLTQEALKLLGVPNVIRAHQHHGPMFDLLCNHNGVVCLWDFDNKLEVFKLKPGLICTLQLAHSSGMYNFNYDAFACLEVHGADTKDWVMQKINVPHRYGKVILKQKTSSTIVRSQSVDISKIGDHGVA